MRGGVRLRDFAYGFFIIALFLLLRLLRRNARGVHVLNLPAGGGFHENRGGEAFALDITCLHFHGDVRFE